MSAPVSIANSNAGRAIASFDAPRGTERERLAEAARQFEAIFVRQMLSAARNTDFGGEETFREMRDARFAEVAAGTGSLGLAATIEAQLARFVSPQPDGYQGD